MKGASARRVGVAVCDSVGTAPVGTGGHRDTAPASFAATDGDHRRVRCRIRVAFATRLAAVT